MSERNKPHQGRDVDGRFRVRQEDVDDLLASPEGSDCLRDDVRLGGAVADTGSDAGKRAERISELVDENRFEVGKAVHPDRPESKPRRPARRNRGNH